MALTVRSGDFDVEPADAEGSCRDSLTVGAGLREGLRILWMTEDTPQSPHIRRPSDFFTFIFNYVAF